MNAISNPASFREEARFQRVCAMCGSSGAYHAHHVVPKQWLSRNGQVHRLYDPRNALRLCDGLDGPRCHMNFESRKLVIETARLPPNAMCFIYETMGVAGQNFLERMYTGVE